MDFVYDATNHLERIVDPAGNFRHYQYDALGNPVREALFVNGSSPDGNAEQTQRFDYGDPLADPGLMAGKPWKAIRPNHDDTIELETVYGYDDMGNVVSVTDARTNTTTYQYDDFNRIKCTEQPGVVVTEYGYDAHGNLKYIIDPEGLETMYYPQKVSTKKEKEENKWTRAARKAIRRVVLPVKDRLAIKGRGLHQVTKTNHVSSAKRQLKW